jgi:hypothetical protein
LLEPSTVIWEAIDYSWIERSSENIKIFFFSKELQAISNVAPWSRSASYSDLSILRSRQGVVTTIRVKRWRMLKRSIEAQADTGQ